MARFKNASAGPLDFRLGGAMGPKTHVEPGGEIDVPDRIAYCIGRSGLPLERIDGPAEATAPVPLASAGPAAPGPKAALGPDAPPWSADARRWYDRTQELAATAAEAGRRAKDLEGQLEAAHDRAEDNHQRAEEAVRRATDAETAQRQLEGQVASAVAFVAQVREKLGIGAEDSVGVRLDELLAAEAEVDRLRAELEAATAPAAAPPPAPPAPPPPGAETSSAPAPAKPLKTR
jgi:hypothetical protein